MKKILMTIMFSAVAIVSQSWGASEGDMSRGASPHEEALPQPIADFAHDLRSRILPAAACGDPITIIDPETNEQTTYDQNQLGTIGFKYIHPLLQQNLNSDSSEGACFLRIAADSLFGGAPGEEELTVESIAKTLLILHFDNFGDVVKNTMSINAGDAEFDAYGIFMFMNGLWPRSFLSPIASELLAAVPAAGPAESV